MSTPVPNDNVPDNNDIPADNGNVPSDKDDLNELNLPHSVE